MRFNGILALLGVAATTAAIGLHKAVDGLLQVTPSFSGDGILMHPGLDPDHNPDDLEHLIPNIDKVLHYSQEGHRPALHGAKHASLEAKFIRGTVILDQSDHIKSVTCDDNDIQVCFKTPHALKAVEDSWTQDFNLATYHVGCGDESSGKRSFFHASQPLVNTEDMCVVMPVTPISESEALDSGVLTWGTYTNPNERRRTPVKGHVRLTQPTRPYRRYRPTTSGIMNGTMGGNVPEPGSSNVTMDIVTNSWALDTFFNSSQLKASNEMIDTFDFMDMEDPEIPETPTNETHRLSTRSRADRTNRSMTEISKRSSSELARRGFWSDVWSGLKELGRRIGNFFRDAFAFIKKIGDFIVEVAIISAKLLLVPFGVPFDHTYHSDIYVHEYLRETQLSNKPPSIFGLGNGFTLAKSLPEGGVEWAVQCAKCGIHVNMNIYGRLAFSIKAGITEGTIQLTNNDPLTLDAQFGVTASGKLTKSKDKPLKRKGKELKNIPLSPLTIPGILTLGPQVSFSVALTVEAERKVELLVGGTLSVSKGTATASVAGGKNGIEGLETTFDPVFRAKGEFTVTADIGIPMALEVGLDVLEGKFKKTVGLVNTPSVYLQAGVSNDEKSTCSNGIELKVGAKNRIHVAGFDIWEYELASLPIFEKTIACVTAKGFNPGNEQNDKGLINSIVHKLGGDPNAGNPHITDATKDFKKIEGAQGFRILMDAEGDTIMVSGVDGNLYLVGKNQGYDVSAPWGTLDTKENPLTLDVFGRVLSYDFYRPRKRRLYGKLGDDIPILADLAVTEPKLVPWGYRATAMKQLKSDGTRKTYGIPMVFEKLPRIDLNEGGLDVAFYYAQKPMFYPTACKTDSGLRIFGTREIITKDGKVKSAWSKKDFQQQMERELEYHLGVKIDKCRTVQLVSEKQ